MILLSALIDKINSLEKYKGVKLSEDKFIKMSGSHGSAIVTYLNEKMGIKEDRIKSNKITNNNTFNIGFGKNYSVLEVFKVISKLLNSQIEPVHKQDLPGEAFQNLADISRAKDIGWEPQVNLEKGLELSIAYIRKYILN